LGDGFVYKLTGQIPKEWFYDDYSDPDLLSTDTNCGYFWGIAADSTSRPRRQPATRYSHANAWVERVGSPSPDNFDTAPTSAPESTYDYAYNYDTYANTDQMRDSYVDDYGYINYARLWDRDGCPLIESGTKASTSNWKYTLQSL